MGKSPLRWRRPGFFVGVLAAAGLLTVIACGGESTAPPTATTAPAPTATATNTPVPDAPATSSTTTTTVVAAPVATATPVPEPKPEDRPKSGGLFRFIGSSDPSSFDVHTATSSAHITHNGMMYSSLMMIHEGTNIILDAAEGYEISDDGKTWTFTLKPNVFYHSNPCCGFPDHPRDGTAMTSADAKWSLEKIMGLHGQLISARSGWIKEFVDIDRDDNGISIIDEQTFKVHLVQAFPGLALVLSINFTSILPDGIEVMDMKDRPYGSGPFKLKDYQRGAFWRYERNGRYFKAGLPYLDEAEHVNIRGTEVVQQAFLTNKVDMGWGHPTPDNVGLFKAKVDSGEIVMNPYATSCRPIGININATTPPFDDVRLRQAINLAIDRQAWREVVHFGHSEYTQYLDPGGWGKEPSEIAKLPGFRQPHAPDVEEAKRMVAEIYPDGLDVDMMVRNSSGYMRAGEFVAGELRKIGINVTTEILDAAQLFPKATNLDYKIWPYWFCQTTMTPAELFGSYFVTGGSRNWLGYSNPVIDANFLDMVATTDPAARKVKAMELEEAVLADMPIVPTTVPTSSTNHYSYIKGYKKPVGLQYMWPRTRELYWRTDV